MELSTTTGRRITSNWEFREVRRLTAHQAALNLSLVLSPKAQPGRQITIITHLKRISQPCRRIPKSPQFLIALSALIIIRSICLWGPTTSQAMLAYFRMHNTFPLLHRNRTPFQIGRLLTFTTNRPTFPLPWACRNGTLHPIWTILRRTTSTIRWTSTAKG